MATDLQQALLDELGRIFEPVTAAAESQQRRRQLFEAIGWNIEVIPGLSLSALDGIFTAADAAYEQILVIAERPTEGLEETLAALDTGARAVEVVQRLGHLLDAQPTRRPPDFEKLPGELLTYLTTHYLWTYRPRIFQLLTLLTLIEPETPRVPRAADVVVDEVTGVVLRVKTPRATLRFDRLGPLLTNPAGTLGNYYLGTNGLTTEQSAQEAANRLFPRLVDFLSQFGVSGTYGFSPDHGVDFGSAGSSIARRSAAIFAPLGEGSSGQEVGLGAILSLSSADQGGLGLVIRPFGTLELSQIVQSWLIGFELGLSAPAFAVGSRGLTLPSGASGRVSARAIGRKLADDSGAALLVGSSRGTRLEIGHLQLSLEGTFDGDRQEYGFLAEASSAAIVVAPGDGDGFLQKILPSEGVRTSFDLALGWSNTRGLYLRGSAGLEATLPIGQDVLGVLHIQTAHISVHPEGDIVRAWVGATFSAQLGPIKVAVEQLGLEALLSFPDNGGNLGVADLELKFKPPKGAGLVIDAGIVVGGGYLQFDPERGHYAGAVQLELGGALELTAFGLLTTRLPDGSPGFSLLVLIAARFSPPIQLGWGFTLNGVGGMLGVNRTVAVDVMRAGLHTGTLGSVLFPSDPVRNAPQILSDLQAIFPPAEGRFLFGPMVMLGWGSPTLLTLELGLILELPAPVRLFVLGRLRVRLPTERLAIVRLQLDALGVIDFEAGEVSLDAVLYDSQVALFTVTGGMAMRINWRSNPGFLLAIGGFNPRFKAPPAFPTVGRVAISLATGNNPRLRLEAYLAITTNTIQFGANLELYAALGPFSIEGYLGFDVLLQFAPFGFAVDLRAGVALKFNGRSVLGIDLALSLSGPSPWYAFGKATFTVLFISATIGFEVTIGEPAQPALPPPVDLRPELLKALGNPGNWSTQIPSGMHPIVSLRDRLGTTDVLVHPLAVLQVSQRVVPLGREISRFGDTPITGDRSFTLSVVDRAGVIRTTPEQGIQPVEDLFAPSQFRDMSDDEKLTAPAFESMQSGVRFVPSTCTYGTVVVDTQLSYERKAVYAPRPSAEPARAPAPALAAAPVRMSAPSGDGAPRLPSEISVVKLSLAPRAVPSGFVERVAATGAAGVAPIARSGSSRYSSPVGGVSLRPPTFIVAGRQTDDTHPTGSPPGDTPSSYSEAVEEIQHRSRTNLKPRSSLQVVPFIPREDR